MTIGYVGEVRRWHSEVRASAGARARSAGWRGCGFRRKVERIDKADAQRDLDELLALRASALTPNPRRQRLVTFGEAIDAWMAEGCPTAAPSSRGRHARTKSPNTIANVRYLLDGHVRPEVGKLWVDRTTTERLEAVFRKMAAAGYATSTIHHTWLYLNQACLHALRQRRTKQNPAADVLLPEARPPKTRKSFTIEQLERLLVDTIPQDARPAMWLTGLMCGLRPGELAGLRWPFVDIDGDEPSIDVVERSHEVDDRYAGQAKPKTARRANEDRLLDRYATGLAARGIDYPREELVRDYKRTVAYRFVHPIVAAGQIEVTSERHLRLVHGMLDRSITAIEDTGAVDILP